MLHKTACTARHICTLGLFHFGLLLRHVLLNDPGWPHTWNPSASASQVQRAQVSATTLRAKADYQILHLGCRCLPTLATLEKDTSP